MVPQYSYQYLKMKGCCIHQKSENYFERTLSQIRYIGTVLCQPGCLPMYWSWKKSFLHEAVFHIIMVIKEPMLCLAVWVCMWGGDIFLWS